MKRNSIVLHLLIAAILLGSVASLSARTAQMLYFRAPKDAPKSVHIYQVGNEPLEVDLKRNNFSKSFKLGDGETILRFLGSPLTVDEEFPENAPSLEIPAEYDKVLILAFPDPANPVLPVSFKVLNANRDTFGAGDRMFINFTDSRIIGKVGKQKLDLGALSIEVVKNAAKPKEEYQVMLNRVDSKREKTYTFIRQTWRQSPTRRSLLFVYSPPGSSGITYYNAPVRDL